MSERNVWCSILLITILAACANKPTSTPVPVNTPMGGYESFFAENLDPAGRPDYPNLWSEIDGDKITIYPYDWLSDYSYAKDGSLWMVGGFGAIHRDIEGNESWYFAGNGLSNNFLRTVAISPTGEVWVGGNENALFRFDGERWFDEGVRLPPPVEQPIDWLCYSLSISGIDFGPDGSAWVMNNGIEVYRQAYGLWMNIPFPAHLLPYAGGGACPVGIRVVADNDVTIKRNGCCDSFPVGYHWDGEAWRRTEDYALVDELLLSRRRTDADTVWRELGSASTSQFLGDWHADYDLWLPIDLYGDFRLHHPSVTLAITGDVGEASIRIGIDKPYLSPQEPYVVNLASFRANDARTPGYTVPANTAILAIGNLAEYWTQSHTGYVGGTLASPDGRLWAGSTGVVWAYWDEVWHRMDVPQTDKLFESFIQDENGIVYGATSEGVYAFDDGGFTHAVFTQQGLKPLIVTNDGRPGDCSFHLHYRLASNCPGSRMSSPEKYELRFLGLQRDGSVVYINSRVVASFHDGHARSFLFDTFTIDAATVDPDGFIWIFSASEGLLRLSPDIFDDYQPLLEP